MAKKNQVVRLRVSDDEASQIRTAAAAAGLTLSAYILFKLGLLAGDSVGAAIAQKKGR